jgi:hypothetical protein
LINKKNKNKKEIKEQKQNVIYLHGLKKKNTIRIKTLCPQILIQLVEIPKLLIWMPAEFKLQSLYFGYMSF